MLRRVRGVRGSCCAEYGGPPYFEIALFLGPRGGLGGPSGPLPGPLILGGAVTSCQEAVVADSCLY